LTWSLTSPSRAYEHFGPPFVLTTTQLWKRLRNVSLRLVRPGTLLPVEVDQYDERIVLEAVHNAIAHQDYARAGRGGPQRRHPRPTALDARAEVSGLSARRPPNTPDNGCRSTHAPHELPAQRLLA
jgi:hypothetical protein